MEAFLVVLKFMVKAMGVLFLILTKVMEFTFDVMIELLSFDSSPVVGREKRDYSDGPVVDKNHFYQRDPALDDSNFNVRD